MYNVFDNEVILITGGTGSLGQALVQKLLSSSKPSKIIVYSRDEMKQWVMAQKFQNEKKLRFFIGDVRDKERLARALDGVTMVIHAAATKIVPTAEYNPFECIKTNIFGAMNVIDVSLDKKIKKVVALSTDKACSPANLYGATKLCSDKLFSSASAYAGEQQTKFAVVRYGNVMGSRGSVIPFFLKVLENEEYPVTHPEMTRFMITLNQGIDLVVNAFNTMVGGEIYVKKIPSINILDIVKAINPEGSVKTVGIRPGEKIHESMITAEDAHLTYEFETYFKILPLTSEAEKLNLMKVGGTPVAPGFAYSSDNNTDWMSVETLRDWIADNKNGFINI